jgi:hypothetical protein
MNQNVPYPQSVFEALCKTAEKKRHKKQLPTIRKLIEKFKPYAGQIELPLKMDESDLCNGESSHEYADQN